LRQQSYRTPGRIVRGLLRRYLAKMTDLSRAQATRLIGQYMEHSEVNLVLGFFARVDAKASGVLGINTGMLAVLASNAPPFRSMGFQRRAIPL